MEADFWHKRWEDNNIPFHEGKPNTLLVRHIDTLKLPENGRVFIPLCGKTKDFDWLSGEGYRTVGAELSEIAIQQLFDELSITPDISEVGAHKHYTANGIDVWVGDIFQMTAEMLGPVDATFDRAAMVAMPASMRQLYVDQVADITCNAPQLLTCFEYDQSLLEGPPFDVKEPEVRELYGRHYDANVVERVPIKGGLKGKCPSDAVLWHLTPHPK